MRVPKVSVLKMMVLALTLMNALKIHILAHMMQFVLTLKEVILANAQQISLEILTMVYVQLLFDVVHLIVNVGQTKNVFNLENAFAHHHFSLTQETFAGTRVKGFLVESMQNAALQILHNACVKQALRVTLLKVALAQTNVQMLLVAMELNALHKKVATNVYAQMECRVILTRVAASTKIQKPKYNVPQITTVHQTFVAITVTALALVLTYCVEQTPFVNLKIMRDGAVAVLDSKKDQVETVSQVCYFKKLIFLAF